jgi:hypothetical protein
MTIKPALTPEEWAKGEYRPKDRPTMCLRDGGVRWPDWNGESLAGVGGESAHAMAALCLYGQPFGFTRSDVEAIRRPHWPANWDRIDDLADRIEALLPPEEVRS